jgi:hypothetical protein
LEWSRAEQGRGNEHAYMYAPSMIALARIKHVRSHETQLHHQRKDSCAQR